MKQYQPYCVNDVVDEVNSDNYCDVFAAPSDPIGSRKRRRSSDMNGLLNHVVVNTKINGCREFQVAVNAPKANRAIKSRKLYDDGVIRISSAISCSCCGVRSQCWNCIFSENRNVVSQLETFTTITPEITPNLKVLKAFNPYKPSNHTGVSTTSSLTTSKVNPSLLQTKLLKNRSAIIESISKLQSDSLVVKEMLQSSAPAECEACFKIVSKTSLLKHRSRIHNLTLKEYQCPHCAKHFKSKKDRLKHMEKLHENYPASANQIEKDKFQMYLYDCPICATTRSYVDLSNHMQNKHQIAIQDVEKSLSCTCPFCLMGAKPVKRSFQSMDRFLSHLSFDHPGSIMLGRKVCVGSLVPSGDLKIIRHGSTSNGLMPRGVDDIELNLTGVQDTYQNASEYSLGVQKKKLNSGFDSSSKHYMSQSDGVNCDIVQSGKPDSFKWFFENYVLYQLKKHQEKSGPLRKSFRWILEHVILEDAIYESLCDGYTFNDLPFNLSLESDRSTGHILSKKNLLVRYCSRLLVKTYKKKKMSVGLNSRRFHRSTYEKIPIPLKEATPEDISDRINILFKCSVCLEIMNDIHAIPQCFHRICYKCSIESFRKCSNRCPECKTRVSSKRNLRKDKCFDQLKNLIYSDAGNVKCLQGYDGKMEESIRRCFQCSKCSDITEETYAIPECFHRLCKNCAATTHNNFCPKCMCHHGSNLPIRRDTKFDELKELLFSSDGLFKKISEASSI